MRIPKFRAWVKAEKRMLTVGEIDFDYEFAYLEEENGYRCESSYVSRKEIISGMEQIMDISLAYADPCVPDVNDWGTVYSIADKIYRELKLEEEINYGSL